MELTQNYDIGIIERIKHERAFAEALLDEVDETADSKEYSITQEVLRVLVIGTVGFDGLSHTLPITSEKLQELLEAASPPPASQLSAITKALRLALGVAAS